MSNEDDAVEAVLWALNQGAMVINSSFYAYPDDLQLHKYDKFHDFYVRNWNRVFVVVAGNQADGWGNGTGNVTSPGRGWNVITVGSYWDYDNSTWSDDLDRMSTFSSFVDPEYPPVNDREKPEVVAVGSWVTSTGHTREIISSPYVEVSGTSYAAPQVAGLAALIMERGIESILPVCPQTIKAIIMASAIHNIEEEARLSERDGAGAISALTADRIVSAGEWNPQTNQGQWVSKQIFPGSFGGDGNLNDIYSFNAFSGQRVRVAITWFSKTTGPPEFDPDLLALDLDLYIYNPDNQPIIPEGMSASFGNASEIVDFVAPETGNYTIKIHKCSWDLEQETDNMLGVAWITVDNEAEPGISQELAGPNKTDPVLAPVNIDRIINSANYQVVQAPGGIKGYSAKVTYQTTPSNHPPILILAVQGGDPPFDSPQISIDNINGITRFSDETIEVGQQPPEKLARLVIRLDGCAKELHYLNLGFESVTAQESGRNIIEETVIPVPYQRGDAKKNIDDDYSDDVDADDAMYISQYLAQLRPLSDLNAVNAATPHHNNPWDKITIADALCISQYLSDIGDCYFVLIPKDFASSGGAAGQGTATVEIGSIQMTTGTKNVVPIVIKDITSSYGLGAYDLRVTFDPKNVQVNAVQSGSSSLQHR